jgi:hypothetical protein
MDEPRYLLEIRVTIRENRPPYGQGLHVEESAQINAFDFDGIAKVLQRFHDLTELFRGPDNNLLPDAKPPAGEPAGGMS